MFVSIQVCQIRNCRFCTKSLRRQIGSNMAGRNSVCQATRFSFAVCLGDVPLRVANIKEQGKRINQSLCILTKAYRSPPSVTPDRQPAVLYESMLQNRQ